MRKEEFLEGLQRALTGNVAPIVIQENLSFYRSYINEQMNNGMAEEDVIAEMGDPRLIAKTIEDTSDSAEGKDYNQTNDYSSSEQQPQRKTHEPFSGHSTFGLYRFDKWYWKLAGIVIFIIVLVIIGGVFAILAQLFIPIMFVLAIWWCINLFRRK